MAMGQHQTVSWSWHSTYVARLARITVLESELLAQTWGLRHATPTMAYSLFTRTVLVLAHTQFETHTHKLPALESWFHLSSSKECNLTPGQETHFMVHQTVGPLQNRIACTKLWQNKKSRVDGIQICQVAANPSLSEPVLPAGCLERWHPGCYGCGTLKLSWQQTNIDLMHLISFNCVV